VLADGAERVCQPTGAIPAAFRIAAAARAMLARSVASSMPEWRSQRQPWHDTSWPRATASLAIQGERSIARPHEL